MRPKPEHVRRSPVRGTLRRAYREPLGLRDRFDQWWNTGYPSPSDLAFALLCVCVFVFIAKFGR